MYAKITVKLGAVTARFSTLDHEGIYDFLLGRGYSHYEAAEVADWAELASIEEEYELNGAEIVIEE